MSASFPYMPLFCSRYTLMGKQRSSYTLQVLGRSRVGPTFPYDMDSSEQAQEVELLDSPSFEALDPHDPNLSKLAVNMFSKTEEFITNEINAPLEDYKLLEEMNKATVAKYSDMRQIAENLSVSTNELSSKFQQLIPMMQQIDEISDTVDKLEAAAYKLDAYTIALENRVKSVLQRKAT